MARILSSKSITKKMRKQDSRYTQTSLQMVIYPQSMMSLGPL